MAYEELTKTIALTDQKRAEGRWYQSSWANIIKLDDTGLPASYDKATTCGTSHCVAGWAPYALGYEGDVVRESYTVGSYKPVEVGTEWIWVTLDDVRAINDHGAVQMYDENFYNHDPDDDPQDCVCGQTGAYLRHGGRVVITDDAGRVQVHVADWAAWKLGLTQFQAESLFSGSNEWDDILSTVDRIVQQGENNAADQA